MNGSYEEQLQRLVVRHARRGIFLDTNVLLLLLFHQFLPHSIGGPRLEKYSVKDAELLASFVNRFVYVFTTPHVLTETSNLAAQAISGSQKRELFKSFFPLFCSDERGSLLPCKLRRTKISPDLFVKLGLTDAVVVSVTANRRLLLTDDLDLHVAAISSGVDSINFTHMREAAGLLGI